MRKKTRIVSVALLVLGTMILFAAYHHRGERDSGHFLKAYPGKAGGKLDHCALCHGGG